MLAGNPVLFFVMLPDLFILPVKTKERMVKLQGETRSVLLPNPDNQLMARIRRALRNSGYAPLFRVRVVVDQGAVFLEGEVPTYFLKQVAQTRVLSLDGVKTLTNELVVERNIEPHF
ncbi:BON domain-containing protein [uncultured Gimesia sp.]|uniref:BON domain-containing protein n=1 Tax=uncultured Gimesia sp. TaxID=1678688 RepID=UPI0030DD2A4C